MIGHGRQSVYPQSQEHRLYDAQGDSQLLGCPPTLNRGTGRDHFIALWSAVSSRRR